MSDNELGAFLRSRREAVKPADVGLPGGPRRRTPGLRRSELATVAGISVEYLTRLEQGRDRNPSTQVLVTLADALRMTQEERLHLRNLAKVAGGGVALCMAVGQAPSRDVRPTVRALLDRLEPAPAAVLNRLGDVIAHTEGYARLFEPLGLLDGDPPNVHRFVFEDERARDAYPEWDRVAAEHAALLKLVSGYDDLYVDDLVSELSFTAGEAFTSRFAAPPLTPIVPVERVTHPGVGELRLSRETLDLPDGEQSIVVHLPAGADTADALDRLTGRVPGGLHAVHG
ncbi:XRE family transcriptional regulator [Nonomuraea deserti]|uniref:XRE family transcriptional regulator n=1 Tax=Nonomuraea deserti TaxID=1848322 RepID=A0A4R4VLV7_9ACTN|nr:helix-turn-helix transcriptional regulator [Nonomuraea deserti]TDD03175.1 XRE family transcriptional regulator [Nonomuraea deserti]